MSSGQQLLREQFGLSKTEDIYDDFGCAQLLTVPVQGRLYLTLNYICFASNILGMNKKLTFSYDDVTQINRRKVLGGMLDSGIELMRGDQESIVFCSFQDRDLAYRRIKALWRNVSQHAVNDDSEDDEDDEGFRSGSVSPHLRSIGSTNKSPRGISPALHGRKQSVQVKGQADNDEIKQLQQANQNQRKMTFDTRNNAKTLQGQPALKSQLSEIKLVKPLNRNIPVIEESDTSDSYANDQITFQIPETNNQDDSLQMLKQSLERQTPIYQEISDAQLTKMLEIQEPLNQDWMQLILLVLPMSVQKFFDTFFSDKAEFGPDAFGKRMERKEITLDNWKSNEQGIPIKWLRSLVPVKGVPFLSQTRHQKQFRLSNKDGNRLQIDGTNKSLDIPYADSFQVLEQWIVISDAPTTNKCILRISIFVEFVKSTLFKGRIISKTQEGMKENFDQWVKIVKELGYLEKKVVVPQREVNASNQQQPQKKSVKRKSKKVIAPEQKLKSASQYGKADTFSDRHETDHKERGDEGPRSISEKQMGDELFRRGNNKTPIIGKSYTLTFKQARGFILFGLSMMITLFFLFYFTIQNLYVKIDNLENQIKVLHQQQQQVINLLVEQRHSL